MLEIELNPIELRILGCLMEKEVATPDNYPLSLNALVNACSQKSNRDPVISLGETVVRNTLEDLRLEHKLVLEFHSSGSRVLKYKHNFLEHWDLSPAKTAILCELFLRGPQTAGDLRARASRLCPLANHLEVEEHLRELEQHEDGPFVVHLPREPGKREQKWAHLFSGEVTIETAIPVVEAPTAAPANTDQLEALEAEVADLRRELDELKDSFAQFKTAFE